MTVVSKQSSSVMDYRHTCTADDPWTRDKSFYGDHPDAVLQKFEPDGPVGMVYTYHCPHCDRVFREWSLP